MNRSEWLIRLKSVPDNAREFLLGDDFTSRLDYLRSDLGYDEDAWSRITDAIWDAVLSHNDRIDFETAIKSILNGRNENDLLKSLYLILLPINDLIDWDVEGAIIELGVNPKILQSIKRLSLLPVTFTTAAKRISASANITLLQEELIRRVRDLLVSVISGVRSDAQALEFLTRRQTEGGVGFTQEQATAFIREMKEFIATSTIISEQQYAEIMRSAKKSDFLTWKAPLEQLNSDEENDTDEDTLAPNPGTVLTQKYEPILAQAITECLQQIGDIGLNEYLAKRLENVISTRLRSVRNTIQTIGILTRPDSIGGLGLPQEQADRISKIIEASFELHHSAIEEDQKRKIVEAQEVQKQKIEERKKRESDEHAEWYRQKMGETSFNAPPQSSEFYTSPRPTQSLSGITAPMAPLSDLIGELRMMDTQTFRRLAKEPEQAAEKLLQKFDTLRNESFERYTTGIASWRSSPLQQRYLQLVSESFTQGKTVSEIAEAKRSIDPLTPTAEELGAIMTVNAKIQY